MHWTILNRSFVCLELLVNVFFSLCTVHLGGGIWGVLSVPIFNKESGILYTGSLLSFRSFGWNLLGVVVIMAWSAALAFLLFIILHVTKQLRVSEEIELKGKFSVGLTRNLSILKVKTLYLILLQNATV